MSKKSALLIVVAVVLGALYLVYFTDLFRKPEIQISARPRVDRARNAPPGTSAETYSVSFSFDQKCELTELKVVPVSDIEKNKYARPVWHLISDKSSPTLKGLVYGENIKGMKPSVPKAKPEKLEAGIKYRLIIEAGKRTGQVDFEIPARRTASR